MSNIVKLNQSNQTKLAIHFSLHEKLQNFEKIVEQSWSKLIFNQKKFLK